MNDSYDARETSSDYDEDTTGTPSDHIPPNNTSFDESSREITSTEISLHADFGREGGDLSPPLSNSGQEDPRKLGRNTSSYDDEEEEPKSPESERLYHGARRKTEPSPTVHAALESSVVVSEREVPAKKEDEKEVNKVNHGDIDDNDGLQEEYEEEEFEECHSDNQIQPPVATLNRSGAEPASSSCREMDLSNTAPGIGIDHLIEEGGEDEPIDVTSYPRAASVVAPYIDDDEDDVPLTHNKPPKAAKRRSQPFDEAASSSSSPFSPVSAPPTFPTDSPSRKSLPSEGEENHDDMVVAQSSSLRTTSIDSPQLTSNDNMLTVDETTTAAVVVVVADESPRSHIGDGDSPNDAPSQIVAEDSLKSPHHSFDSKPGNIEDVNENKSCNISAEEAVRDELQQSGNQEEDSRSEPAAVTVLPAGTAEEECDSSHNNDSIMIPVVITKEEGEPFVSTIDQASDDESKIINEKKSNNNNTSSSSSVDDGKNEMEGKVLPPSPKAKKAVPEYPYMTDEESQSHQVLMKYVLIAEEKLYRDWRTRSLDDCRSTLTKMIPSRKQAVANLEKM